ncbi:hypothetical protein BDP27DRAFT_1226510 [Rhodocollybia butyracea]|uniref:Mitochondrial import inner membrane translocase subunit TIM50 n=1 Tax=Rhodocollybia butyracea TaxID=206335 RepID=A0A9P5PSC9_9AGAR|nr:hypothetical protein BDP27DRAFT_1226510 [Rhodocollybia butyracea]
MTTNALSTSERKLLVLDLNGSLLFRPSRYKKSNNGGTNVRTVLSRPYVTPFREYLFHPETSRWLDTMVWSSAQPHSVDHMVKRVFGDYTKNLKATWARDTLDLTPDKYKKKSKTVKDLTKIWNAFPTFSAQNTLLIDDSTDKANLQPWNHLFIKEYGEEERRHDMRVVPALRKNPAIKEPEFDISKLAERLRSNLRVNDAEKQKQPDRYDDTLLAVIGILDALEHEKDVAAWLQSGGIILCGKESEPSFPGGVIGDRWFDQNVVLDCWVERGRATLGRLKINEVVGVVKEVI